VRPRFSPAPLAFGIAATGLVALALRPPEGSPVVDLLIASLAGLLGLSAALAWRALAGLRFEREAPETAVQGETVLLAHRLVNATARPARCMALEERRLEPVRVRSFFPHVPAAGKAESRPRLFLGKRGKLALAGVRLRAADPFGVFRVEREDEARSEVLVLPRARRVAGRSLLGSARPRSGVSGRRVAREPFVTEAVAVREYRSGDPMRHVHWRLSARRGSLVVKAFAEDRTRDALLVLDRLPPAGPRGRASFERAVALAAGLGLEVLESGGELAFVAPGDPPLSLERLRGRAGADQLLRALALVEPDTRARDLPPIAPRAGRDAFVVTARGPRSGLAPPVGEGAVRVFAAEGLGPTSSAELASRAGDP
jgi:uncharacterized protein (DUF58 family)